MMWENVTENLHTLMIPRMMILIPVIFAQVELFLEDAMNPKFQL